MTPIKFELPGSTAVHFYAENTFFSLFLTPLLPTADQKTVHVTVPEEFAGERVHFIWDNSSEALLYRDGVPVQAFYGSGGDDRREEYLLSDSAKGGETYEFVVEMVWNMSAFSNICLVLQRNVWQSCPRWLLECSCR